MDVHPLNVHAQVETYEHLGDVETFSMNLEERYRELTMERHAFLHREEADVVLEREFPVTQTVLWEWLNDPKKRVTWMVDSDWHVNKRPQGRTKRGASNHCANSGFLEYILDWRPFSYYTVELVKKPVNIRVTATLEPSEKGTKFTFCARLNGSLPRFVLRQVCKLLIAKGARTPESLDILARIFASQSVKPEIST